MSLPTRWAPVRSVGQRSEKLLRSSHRKSTRTTVLSKYRKSIISPTNVCRRCSFGLAQVVRHLHIYAVGHLSKRRVMRASNLVGDGIEALRQPGDSVAARRTNEQFAFSSSFSWTPKEYAFNSPRRSLPIALFWLILDIQLILWLSSLLLKLSLRRQYV